VRGTNAHVLEIRQSASLVPDCAIGKYVCCGNASELAVALFAVVGDKLQAGLQVEV
jgi:hypothetical protein